MRRLINIVESSGFPEYTGPVILVYHAQWTVQPDVLFKLAEVFDENVEVVENISGRYV